MTAKPVEAILFWKFTKSPFAATYGRLPGTKYSKDFLQSPAAQFPVIDRLLHWAGSQIDIQYRWPGATRPGYWRHSAADERGQLAWPTSDAPAPWRLGDPLLDPAITFAGDPSHKTETAADTEYDTFVARGEGAYIVAVKLWDEDRILHPRAYLANPPPALAHRGLDRLPKIVQEALLKVTEGGDALSFPETRLPRAPKLLKRVLDALDKDPNVLLVGPPGTGKTLVLEELREHYERREPLILFDPDVWDDAWGEVLPQAAQSKVVSLAFHPSYAYENFVVGLVPKGGGNLELVAKPGPLLSLAHWTQGGHRAAMLIADEFNRGAAAAIFGDTLGLLDNEKRDRPGKPGAWIERPFPNDKMEVGQEFAAPNGAIEVGKRITLPAALRIVAAMNSTDRSVAPIDAALRRRFAIINVGPDYEALAERLGTDISGAGTVYVPPLSWSRDEVLKLGMRLLMTINGRILQVLGQDFLLGHALLWQVAGDDLSTVAKALVHAFDERIVATLRMTFVDQDDALGAILGIPAGSTDRSRIGFWRVPDGTMAAVASPRLVINDLASWSDSEQQLRALSLVVSP